MAITSRDSSSLSDSARQDEFPTLTSDQQPNGQSDKPKPSSPPPADAQPQQRPSPVAQSSSTGSTAPAHKKFSAVNIGKKFLEKNAQAAASSSSSSASAAKTSAATVRPTVQPAPTHSRLVTTKLTAAPFAASPAGWSRPSSVAPTSSPGNSAASTPPLPNSKAASPGPQKPSSQKDAGKPVWGNAVKPVARPPILQEDFPTAAEVAKAAGAKPKTDEAKSTIEVAKPSPSRIEDADAFRGVHLDHHWDEEEDDDDFLDKPVEFGDGRQYTVEAVDEHKSETTNHVQDRFADDFDRSWPKSRSSPVSSTRDIPVPPAAQDPNRSPAFSTTGLHSSSPRDSHRVLFNERSNRLEPYNRQPAPPPGGRQNDFGSQNVRVLHKPPGIDAAGPRSRRFSGASAGSAPGIPPSPRDQQFGRGPPPSPRLHRDNGAPLAPTRSFGGREREPRGTMGPPPVPAHALKVSQQLGRPLPPHLTQNVEEQPPSRPTLPPVATKAPSIPSQSPRISQAPLSAVSAVDATSPLVLAGADVEEVRKELMQTAAARAKQRRQQEEAEREAQKERARRKALEIEEKIKAAEAEKVKQAEASKPPPTQVTPKAEVVAAVVEEAVRSVQPEAVKPRLAPPATDIPPKRPSLFGSKIGVSPTAEPTNWRSTAKPITPVVQGPPPQLPAPPRRTSSGFAASTTVALDTAVDGVKEDLEVVDFADMAKLVNGAASPAEKAEAPAVKEKEASYAASRPARPVASDFFDDKDKVQPVEPPKQEDNVWRRKTVTRDAPESDRKHPVPAPIVTKPEPVVAQPEPSSPATKENLSPPEQVNGRPPVNLPFQQAPPRTPRNQAFYKDTGISSLDDAMSRIKGAITDMKAHEVTKEAAPSDSLGVPSRSFNKPFIRDRWVPPALRPRTVGFIDEEHHEVFAVTADEPPQSPVAFHVRLPAISQPREPVNAHRLRLFQKFPPPARFELLSFVPPVEGMNKRDFSVNAVLFRKPQMYKGQVVKYRVSIPRYRGPRPPPMSAVSRLNGTSLGSAGKADGATSWRKPASATPTLPPIEHGLETMSRSPPPEIAGGPTEANIPKSSTESTAAKADTQPVMLRPRAQPKMPAGSAVAFRRDSRIDVVDSLESSVNFIVSDELEDTGIKTSVTEPLPTTTASADLPAPAISAPRPSEPATTATALPTDPPQSTSKDNSADSSRVVSSSHQPSPWARSSINLPMKESTSLGPDPDHLKALWSQPADKPEQLQPVNSLEGIGDDLTSIPFTFPEVKSEDGSTPPPNIPQAPSRMSLHEVTRAFQQVPQPQASSNVPPRPAISPPSTNAPVARPTTSTSSSTNPSNIPTNPGYSYAPMQPNNVRPYPSYPSPLMSHSPAPGMIYPHHPMAASPVPSRMGVNTPIYGQSMWMPISGHPNANPNAVMRPSPYPAQMMPYGTPPAGASNPYSPQGPPPGVPMHHQQPMPNGVQRSGSRNPAISPVMSHAPMYQASPLMMHSPHLPPNQNHAVYGMPNGRPGQPPRGPDGSVNGAPMNAHPPPGTGGPQSGPQQPPHLMYHHNPHAPNASQPYSRTGW